MEYTCIVIDDNERSANHLNQLIRDFTPLKVLWVESDPAKAVQKINRLGPDIVFLDVEMSKSGFEVMKDLQGQEKQPTFIMVTGHEHYAIRAIREEVFDYLMKPVDIDDLQAAIKRYTELKSASKPELNLTHRESEVVQLICEGLTSKEIADRLSISKPTVDSHRQNIMKKTGARNMSQLIALMGM